MLRKPRRSLKRRKSRKRRRLRKKRRWLKMVEYKCFDCNKKVSTDYVRKKVRCPYCGSKILYKPRRRSSKVKAR